MGEFDIIVKNNAWLSLLAAVAMTQKTDDNSRAQGTGECHDTAAKQHDADQVTETVDRGSRLRGRQ